MMASGRPVIACANNGTELANLVRRCGLVVPPENLESFYESLVKLIVNSKLRSELGSEGQKYATTFLSKDIVLSNFESRIKELLFI
jgi:colanic acid biosynthesis glycosyl transferase WcaI